MKTAETDIATSEAVDGAETVFEALEILIGIDLTWQLCDLYGGRTVYIPASPRDGHWLVKAIGQEPARKICAHFKAGYSGIRLLIPKGDRQRSQRCRADIVRMSDQGMSASEIALSLKLHERTVYRARSAINRKRVKIFGKRINRLLSERHTVDEVAKSIGLPIHSTRQVIDLLMKNEA